MSTLSETIEKLKDIDSNLKKLTFRLATEIKFQELGPEFLMLKLILDNIRDPVFIISLNLEILFANSAAKKLIKKSLKVSNIVGKTCYTLFNRNDVCDSSPVVESIKAKKVITKEITNPDGNKWVSTCIPLVYNGVSAVIEILKPHD